MPVVIVEHEALRFITGDVKNIGLKEYVMKKLRHEYRVTQFWANQDINFTLEKGDMLGLLELTAGFDGNLTLRENTYLRGALLGYTRAFMDEMYDSIIAFAELEEFQDRQFKQLSSGMKSRLAFSIACLVNPDILILDEVLSVGDGAFRKKSGDKMREILARGVTGLLVSHSIGQVRELCSKILWIDHGRQILFSDNVETACNAYEEFLMSKELPEDEAGVQALSDAWVERQLRETERKKKAQKKRLVAELRIGSSEAAIEAALEIIRKQKPELLRETALGEEQAN